MYNALPTIYYARLKICIRYKPEAGLKIHGLNHNTPGYNIYINRIE